MMLLDLETETMLTALGILALLWLFGGDVAHAPSWLHLPFPRSASSVAEFPILSAPGTLCQGYACPGGGCAPGGFPAGTCRRGPRDWNIGAHGDCWALLFTKCVCPLGTQVPCGQDIYASQMRGGYVAAPPVYPPSGPAPPVPSP